VPRKGATYLRRRIQEWSGRHSAGRFVAAAEDNMVPDHHPNATPAPAGCLLRLFWMLIGNAIVYASLAVIAFEGAPFPSALDVVVWVTVALTLVARHRDITRWGGQTASGEPATLAHWRRFAAVVILVTAAASVLAHALGGSGDPV